MTGGEIVAGAAAGKALSKIAKDAMTEDESVKQALIAAAKDTPAFKLAVEKRGQRIALREMAMLNLFRLVYRAVGVSKEYFEAGAFAEELTEKVADVPDENLRAPRIAIAAPAMQGLGWSLDEPHLKEMYLNLLAAEVDDRRNDTHPSFAEIIKQLAPDEAQLLNVILPTLTPTGSPMIRLRQHVKNPEDLGGGSGFRDVRKHIFNLRSVATDEPWEHPSVAAWFDNWVRLGLVEIDYNTFRRGDTAYVWADTRPEVILARQTFESEHATLEVIKGLAMITDFGEVFRGAVLPAVVSQSPEQPAETQEGPPTIQ